MNTVTTRRSGLVPFMIGPNGEVLVGVVRSLNGKDWVFPKGHIDPFDLDDERITAIREAREEMGIKCVIIGDPVTHMFDDPISGKFSQFQIVCSLYPAVVEGNGDQVDQRESEFLIIQDAHTRLTYPSHRIAMVTLFGKYQTSLYDLAYRIEDQKEREREAAVQADRSTDHPAK